MRKIILSMMTSLDACIAAADGSLDWFLSDEEFEDEMLGLLRSVDGMLFGRISYQLLAQYWPTAGTSSAEEAPGGFTSKAKEVKFARLMNALPKTVYSRTLARAEWGPATIEREIDAQQLASLKREPGKDLVLFAGADIATAFAQRDLLDEYRLMIHPIVLGGGVRLFTRLNEDRKLVLAGTKTFPSGVVLLQYTRSR